MSEAHYTNDYGDVTAIEVPPATPKHQADQELRDLLLLADVDVPLDVIAKWSDTQQMNAEGWASKVILYASDKNVRIPKKPHCLRGFKPPEAVQP